MRRLQYILVITIVLYLKIAQSIKYTLTTTSGEIIHRNEKKITSDKNVKRVTIQDEFEIFDKNLLEIRDNTEIFLMDKNYRLKKIKSGAFANQSITETVLIANTEWKIVETGTFQNLKIFELILKENEITHIEKQAIVNLPNLESINLSNNKIVEFFETSVIASPAVHLDVAFNRLKKLGARWFMFMNSEKPVTILLDDNEIERIDILAFFDVMLDTLNLKDNKIEELPSEIFEDNTLVTLYIQENYLEALPSSFYELSHLSLGVFTGNPLDYQTQRKLERFSKSTKAKIIFQKSC